MFGPFIGRLISPGRCHRDDLATVLKVARKHYRDCLLARQQDAASEAAIAIVNILGAYARSISPDDETP